MTPKNHRKTCRTGFANPTHITPIALACAALWLPAASVLAQEATQSVVVTGIRRAVETSIATKRNADSIVESVTAEDIGKLPDVSIAESLARLPGVAAQRVDGRAQVLSIRGMAPKFGVTLLNGREMASTGDDRSFEYDQFPSELVNAATIYKTPDPSLGTQGMSGTINLQTVHPLDFGERKINFSARYEKNSFGDILAGNSGAGNRLSASYIDQFADRTIGVALGVAHLDSPIQKKYFNPWDYATGANYVADENPVNGLPDATAAYDGVETGVMSTSTIRDGFLGVLEYKPNSSLHSQIDIFSSQFKQRMNGREFIAYWNNWANGTTPEWAALANSNGGGTISSITPFMTMRKNSRDDKVDAVGWNTEYKTELWSTSADLSYSKAKRHESVGEAYATGINPATLDVRFPAGLNGFGSIKSTFAFGDAASWQLSTPWWDSAGYNALADVQDETKSVRMSAKRALEWGAVSGFTGGIIYSERSKTMGYVGTNYDLTNGADCSMWPYCAPIPAQGFLGSSVNLGFVGMPSVIGFDVGSLFTSSAYTARSADAKSPTWNWGVNEKVTTGYAKLDLDFQAGIPVRGNVGLQIVSATQHATGLYKDANGDLNPVGDGTTYTDVLPSLNLVGELSKDTLLRVGLARTVARPNMADMRAGITASVGQTDRMWSGSGGNPKLQPWRADALDLSIEKYIGKSSYVALAVFNKRITSGIITKDVQFDFSGFTNPTGVTAISNVGTLTTPTNTNGGSVRGVELSSSLSGALVSPSLDGFGIQGSFSSTTSSLPGTNGQGQQTDTKLEGLSGHVFGLTGYYEKDGFQLRVAERYRSAFNATRHNSFKYVVDSIRPERIIDFQTGYEFQSGQFKGLGVLFQVNNLTNTPYVTTATQHQLTGLQGYMEFGRQYLLGLSYKL